MGKSFISEGMVGKALVLMNRDGVMNACRDSLGLKFSLDQVSVVVCNDEKVMNSFIFWLFVIEGKF